VSLEGLHAVELHRAAQARVDAIARLELGRLPVRELEERLADVRAAQAAGDVPAARHALRLLSGHATVSEMRLAPPPSPAAAAAAARKRRG